MINAHLSTASKTRRTFPVSCGTAALQSPVFVGRPGHHHERRRQGVPNQHDAGATPYTCVASAQAGTGHRGVGGGLSAPVVDVTQQQDHLADRTTPTATVWPGIGAFNLNFAANAGPTSFGLLGDDSATTICAERAVVRQRLLVDEQRQRVRGRSPTAAGNTYLIRIRYNGELGAVDRLRRVGPSGGTPPKVADEPGHGVPHRRAAGESRLHLHRWRQRQLQVHEPHQQRVRPARMQRQRRWPAQFAVAGAASSRASSSTRARRRDGHAWRQPTSTSARSALRRARR